VRPSDGDERAMLNALFRIKGTEFGRCLAPGLPCTGTPIRAHSVQNAKVLDLLAQDGHVIAPQVRLDAKTGPAIEFALVGRNRATTFAGLCGEHDRSIFAQIETGELDLDNPAHRFLLAYRATYYALHATIASAAQVQSAHRQRSELGLDAKDQPSPAGIAAIEMMITAWMTLRYKLAYDRAFMDQHLTGLEHDLIELDVSAPTVAASTLFSIGLRANQKDIVGVCLTILPMSLTRTVALFSYQPADATQARKDLAHILGSSEGNQKYELSKRLLHSCQNFALAPDFVASWPAKKRATIIEFFSRTALAPDLHFDDPDLLLLK
jgi:hypothetical protein